MLLLAFVEVCGNTGLSRNALLVFLQIQQHSPTAGSQPVCLESSQVAEYQVPAGWQMHSEN